MYSIRETSNKKLWVHLHNNIGIFAAFDISNGNELGYQSLSSTLLGQNCFKIGRSVLNLELYFFWHDYKLKVILAYLYIPIHCH